ncbi:uncharacterized protein LOC136096120 [Hydra vulgaris]|uniref:uncharacterized protein LOC136096120 n=1 Tax=Hydra vulgaris TaxID=6087 RepID=UPI0032E9CFB8
MPFQSADVIKIKKNYTNIESVPLLPEKHQKESPQLINNNNMLEEFCFKNKLQDELSNKNTLLQENNKILRRKLVKYESHKNFHQTILNTDKNVLFYTGVRNKNVFNVIHGIVFPLIRRKWYGSIKKLIINRKFKSFSNKLGAKTKLCSKDEMLVTLMKIRLALTEKDLFHRFNISISLTSRIFLIWVKGLAFVLRHFVFVLDKGALNFTRPKQFDHIKDIHSIIDATELFTETPKNPDLQKITWSEYKHHNTTKILIIPRFSYVMADKGFNIQNECLMRSITLYVPPGKRGLYQMLPSEIKKTKKNS